MQTQIRCCRMWHLIRVSTVCKHFSHFSLGISKSHSWTYLNLKVNSSNIVEGVYFVYNGLMLLMSTHKLASWRNNKNANYYSLKKTTKNQKKKKKNNFYPVFLHSQVDSKGEDPYHMSGIAGWFQSLLGTCVWMYITGTVSLVVSHCIQWRNKKQCQTIIFK